MAIWEFNQNTDKELMKIWGSSCNLAEFGMDLNDEAFQELQAEMDKRAEDNPLGLIAQLFRAEHGVTLDEVFSDDELEAMAEAKEKIVELAKDDYRTGMSDNADDIRELAGKLIEIEGGS